MMKSKIAMNATGVVLFVLLLGSCPNPISEELMKQISDSAGPVITITSPADRSEYSTMVMVSGTVTDESGDKSSSQIGDCGYGISGTTISGNFSVGDDGSFSFLFATVESDGSALVTGTATLNVWARDWSGNRTTVSLQLMESSTGSIPGFSLIPGSKQVTIAWDEVPGATSYTLYNPRYGEIREGVSSPYVWDNLKNGSLYSFRVEAEVPDELGDNAVSDLKEVIPLSTQSLAPWVSETDYRSITVEWASLSGISEYILQYRIENGPWTVRTITSGTSFTDENIDYNSRYDYRVLPAEQNDIVSNYVTGVPGRFGYFSARFIETQGHASDIAVSDGYAYVADYYSGLTIIDISDPENPGESVFVPIGRFVNDVVISADYAYVTYNKSLLIVDISDPENPGTPVWACGVGGAANGVTVSGSCAYVAYSGVYYDGLLIIDISDPENPGLPVTIDIEGTPKDVAVSDGYAYVANYNKGLAIIDISNTTGFGDTKYIELYDYAVGVTVSGDYAYVADSGSGLAIINISDPENPGNPVYVDTPNSAIAVDLFDSDLYVSGDGTGLCIIDVSDPADPGAPLFIDTIPSSYGVAVSGNNIYTASYGSGMAIIDLLSPKDSGKQVYMDTDGSARGVAVSGPYAYVANYYSGLAIIDISDPAAPGEPVYMDTDGSAQGVAVSGDYAYVADYNSGLAIIDISDPENPGFPVYQFTNSFTQDVTVSNGYAYVADYNSGLAIIDISDPAEPGEPVYMGTDGAAYGVAVSGDYAYVADYNSGLAIIDISDPDNPGSPVYMDTDGTAYGVVASGSCAYVSCSRGLAIVDISDPTKPGSPVYMDTDGTAYGVVASGSYAYLAAAGSGLCVIDLLGDEE